MEIRPAIALAALAALMLATGLGGAQASPSAAAGASFEAQQQEPPKDCKMKPEDPRCKYDKKG